MESPASEALSQALPGYEQVMILVGVLVFALFIQAIARNGTATSTAGRMRLLPPLLLPLIVIVLTVALAAVKEPWGLSGDRADEWRPAWLLFWLVVLVVRFVDGVAGLAYARRKKPFPLPWLLRRAAITVIYVVAAFAVLKYVLDVDITPFVATSAILTMVIGLALQGVLGNLLAGFSLNLVRTVEVGELVRVGDHEGIVVRTNWRETILRTRDKDFVHVPNSLLASQKIVNYSKPSKAHRHTLEVGASYSDAPGDVIEALMEAAKDAESVRPTPPPAAYVSAFLDFGINYKLFYTTESYWSRVRVEGEVARLVWYKFKRRGIEIPFPMSDQLLNDFMAVVNTQRRLPPVDDEVERMAELLAGSAFLVRPVATEDGEPARLLDDAAVRKLARECRFIRYTAGETLCRQGNPGETAYVVVGGAIDGSIEYREGDTTQRQTFEAQPGSLFGEMSLLTGMPRTATGRISQETELLEIPKDAFAALLAAHENVTAEIAELVATRNRENREFLEKIPSLPAEDVTAGCDAGLIQSRLRRLAAWGRRLLG